MSNELIYFLIVIIDLIVALISFRLGKKWLIAFIVTNLLLVSILAGKVVDIFGFSTTVAGPFYAAIFLATDALTEHYGKKIGHRSVLIGFVCMALFALLSQMSLLIAPVEFTVDLHDSMVSVMGISLRVFVASAVAYFIAQNFDVWFYHFIQKKTSGKYLWLRNNLSTISSQILDSAIFFSIAFIGIIPNWIEVAIVGALAKILVALIDTPFIYLTYKIKPKTDNE